MTKSAHLGSMTAGPDYYVVQVLSVSPTTGTCGTRDSLGKERLARYDMRPKGTSAPQQGETWIMDRYHGDWRLSVMLRVPATPVVTGSRALADPVTISLLAALTKLGLIDNQTTA